MGKRIQPSAAMARFVHVLKYRAEPPRRGTKTWTIAKLTWLSVWTVRRICQQGGMSECQPREAKGSRKGKLTALHAEYLTCNETLAQWKALPLARRCIELTKAFPEVSISLSTLRRLCLSHNNTLKAMHERERYSAEAHEGISLKRRQAFEALLAHSAQGRTIVYTNETIFTPFKVSGRAWAARGINQIANKLSMMSMTLAAVVAISSSGGLVSFLIREKSIKARNLVTLARHLRGGMRAGRVTLFIDNLRAHYNREFTTAVASYGWKIVYNAAYSPEYHCIEKAFALVKRRYRRANLGCNYSLTASEHKAIVAECIHAISQQHFQRTELTHYDRMRQFLLE